jgi:hypothetical protein
MQQVGALRGRDNLVSPPFTVRSSVVGISPSRCGKEPSQRERETPCNTPFQWGLYRLRAHIPRFYIEGAWDHDGQG